MVGQEPELAQLLDLAAHRIAGYGSPRNAPLIGRIYPLAIGTSVRQA
jgi:hypothetical protein